MFRSDSLISLNTVLEVHGVLSNRDFNLWEATKGKSSSLYCSGNHFDFSDQQFEEMFLMPGAWGFVRWSMDPGRGSILSAQMAYT